MPPLKFGTGGGAATGWVNLYTVDLSGLPDAAWTTDDVAASVSSDSGTVASVDFVARNVTSFADDMGPDGSTGVVIDPIDATNTLFGHGSDDAPGFTIPLSEFLTVTDDDIIVVNVALDTNYPAGNFDAVGLGIWDGTSKGYNVRAFYNAAEKLRLYRHPSTQAEHAISSVRCLQLALYNGGRSCRMAGMATAGLPALGTLLPMQDASKDFGNWQLQNPASTARPMTLANLEIIVWVEEQAGTGYTRTITDLSVWQLDTSAA